MKTAGKTGGKQQVRRNDDITYPNIRLIDPDGEQLGVVTLEEAQQKAQEAELDLVEVAPGADPPVCRIMDYGKYLFEQKKKQHQARKKQKQIEIKEVKFRPGTDEGDYQVKLRNLRRFLEEGDRAKVSMRFRGREFLHQDVGLKTFDRLEEELADIATVEQRPRIEGRQMVMLLSPKKK